MIAVDKTRQTTNRSRVDQDRQFCIIIPTYNASRYWDRLDASFKDEGIAKDQILVVDSSSTDNTRDLVRRSGYRLKQIPQQSFRHGATRQMAAESMPWADVLLYLTQDALPCGDRPIERLLTALEDPEIGAVYGRQLPRPGADPIESHARMFSYPDRSEVRSFESRHTLGMRTMFFSDAFSAFRRSALEEVGGFPKNTIVSEEFTVVSRMLMQGWKIAYQADATAIHSHPLTVAQEFSRYFDIGVHQGRESWILETFGKASGHGKAFVLSEMKFLLKTKPALIPMAALRNVSKWCSYQLGRHEQYLPATVKEAISAQPNFWHDCRLEAEAAQASVSSQAPIGSRHQA